MRRAIKEQEVLHRVGVSLTTLLYQLRQLLTRVSVFVCVIVSARGPAAEPHGVGHWHQKHPSQDPCQNLQEEKRGRGLQGEVLLARSVRRSRFFRRNADPEGLIGLTRPTLDGSASGAS